MREYQRLKVWQKAVDLTADVYDYTRLLPAYEKYGIVQQMRRASVSICANIAEGAGRSGDREFARFVSIASGSAYELETLHLVVEKLDIIPCTSTIDQIDKNLGSSISEVKRMLVAFHRTLAE